MKNASTGRLPRTRKGEEVTLPDYIDFHED
jgi:hypothetical protein